MIKIEPRDYQKEMVDVVIKKWQDGVSRQMVALPTGTGKTICFALLAKKLNVPTLILAHRDELLSQAQDKILMVDSNADVGIVKAKTTVGLEKQICIASIQSAWRANTLKALEARDFKFLIIDEAHHATADNTYGKVIKALGFMDDKKDKLLLGVTATAFREDKWGLKDIFQEKVFERSIITMIKGGYLTDARGISIKTQTDISDVHTARGDLALNELSLAVNTKARNDLVVKSFGLHCAQRKAIAFCCDIAHSQKLADAFREKGYKAEAIWGDCPERKEKLRRFSKGETQILCNCNVLTEGYDEPSTSAILLARPTKSKGLYTQMVGRGLRLFPMKDDCLVLDFTDYAGRHKLCDLRELINTKHMEVNESLLEAAERMRKAEADYNEKLYAMSICGNRIDLFGQEKFVWVMTKEGHYKLPIGKENLWLVKYLVGEEQEEKYVPLRIEANVTSPEEAKALSHIPLALDYAQGVAEDYARRNIEKGKKILVERGARWRNQSPTEKQLNRLRLWKIAVPANLTKGSADELIQEEFYRRYGKSVAWTPTIIKQKLAQAC